jgi:hypothetical protein
MLERVQAAIQNSVWEVGKLWDSLKDKERRLKQKSE